MRVQHNITALNAYRNFNTNNSQLGANLEKLSSGYKINRAGDNAAGLAISEKMRAQITGLDVAQKNAKDGISLVQTAEGALTEVHDMLNRMYELSEQSANGTFDDDVDRVQLQKEVTALTNEINRIADSANFNGIFLLNGKLGATSSSSDSALTNGGVLTAADSVDGKEVAAAVAAEYNLSVATDTASAAKVLKIGSNDFTAAQTIKAVGSTTLQTGVTVSDVFDIYIGGTKVAWTATTALKAVGDTITLKAKVAGALASKAAVAKGSAGTLTEVKAGTDAGGAVAAQYTATIDLTKLSGGDYIQIGSNAIKFGNGTDANVSLQSLTIATTSAAILTAIGTKANISGFTTGISVSGSASSGFTVTLTYTASTAGTAGNKSSTYGVAEGAISFEQTNKGIDAVSGTAAYAKVSYDFDTSDLEEGDTVTFGVGSSAVTLTVVASTYADSAQGKIKVGATASQVTAALTAKGFTPGVAIADGVLTITDTEQGNTGAELAAGAGKVNVTKGATTASASSGSSSSGNGLTLQIGDTAASYNQLTVEIADMHAEALKLDTISIATRDSAAKALEVIKDAINSVSDTRGGLGAIQNRLEHTINNLGVMQENIQNAESVIRDTDVAEEMMKFTKNSIMNQAAQAMLAQANQLPQGVLQLLQ